MVILINFKEELEKKLSEPKVKRIPSISLKKNGVIDNFSFDQKFISEMVSILGEQYSKANSIAQEFQTLLFENPLRAVKNLRSYIERIRDISSNRAFGESMAGGPNQDTIVPVFNVLGFVYPALDREVRKEGLRQCLNYLDGLRYDYSQNHVELIDEPWLVGDIVSNRSLYWCGYQQQTDLLKKNPIWKDFIKVMTNTQSEFWLAIAVAHPEYSSLEIRTNFYKLFPQLTDRTTDAMAAIVYNWSLNRSKAYGIPLEQEIQEQIKKIDRSLYSKLIKKIEEKKWIRLED
ncbi:hypothetical protein J4403_02280 [Candidatus Woesearchaeota archaeon]|nr:hypothetical protein [Candidatus Woesearchaeota archaeon]